MSKSHYYPPEDTNPRWYAMWWEQYPEPADRLDELCRLACGIEFGASDQCQRYAKHIHAHLRAAYLSGLADAERGRTLATAMAEVKP